MGADFDHLAGAFMTGNQGQLGRHRPVPVNSVDVCVANTALLHTNQHLHRTHQAALITRLQRAAHTDVLRT
jgi:hypothetical protein